MDSRTPSFSTIFYQKKALQSNFIDWISTRSVLTCDSHMCYMITVYHLCLVWMKTNMMSLFEGLGGITWQVHSKQNWWSGFRLRIPLYIKLLELEIWIKKVIKCCEINISHLNKIILSLVLPFIKNMIWNFHERELNEKMNKKMYSIIMVLWKRGVIIGFMGSEK